jgi:mRNA-degrading endonuclease RelE of RelBE toxin-antitoxin system
MNSQNFEMLTIKYSERFLKDAKRLKEKKNFRKIADDIKEVENWLKSGEVKGDLIPGLSGLQIFKIRQKNSSVNSGKSGGFRIIYYQIREDDVIVMLTIYSKTETESVSRQEILEILKQI